MASNRLSRMGTSARPHEVQHLRHLGHIFPQSALAPPHGAWGKDIQTWGIDADALGERMNRLGNLTLLTFAANRFLKAKDFISKKAVFTNSESACPHPILSISQSVTSAARWSPEAIDDRTQVLADAAIARWPHTHPST